MLPYIISIDDFKEKIEGYSPERASEFHVASAKMADKEFGKVVKNHKIGKVIFLAGGSASGKTEYLHTYLLDEGAIIFDSTLSSPEGARIKIKKAKKYNKKIELHFVLPDDIKRSFAAFLGRDRRFDDRVFYETHSNSRSTLLWIANNYSDIKIKILESYYKNGKLKYKVIEMGNRDKILDYIESLQYDKEDIMSKVIS